MPDIELSRKNTIMVLLYIYAFICIFFPMDKYSIKIVTFMLICILGIPDFSFAYSTEQMHGIFFMGVIFPLLTVIISIIHNHNILLSASGSYVGSLILLVIPITMLELSHKFNDIVIKLLWVEAIITFLIFLLDFLGIFDVNAGTFLRRFIYDMGSGIMGKSNAYSSYYKIYLKTSPLLLFLLDDSWNKKKWIRVIITVGALYISGTRANLLMTLFYIAWRLIFKTFKDRTLQVIFAAIVILAMVLAVGFFINKWTAMMSTSGSVISDNIRSGQLRGLLESLSNPSILLFGAGVGTPFYDYGRSVMESGVELAYIDLLRQIGLILFIPFMVFAFYPIFNKRISASLRIAFLGYMAIAFTNPLLFSSTAYIAYIIMYNEIYQYKMKNGELLTENQLFIAYIKSKRQV